MSKGKKGKPVAPPSILGGSEPAGADAEVDFMKNIEILNKLLFAPDAKLRDAAKAINEMLAIVENILLSGFFTEYRKWISTGGQETMPEKIVQWGEKIHKLIVARGRLVMDMLQQIKEDETNTKDEVTSSGLVELFQLPEALLGDLGEDEEEEEGGSNQTL